MLTISYEYLVSLFIVQEIVVISVFVLVKIKMLLEVLKQLFKHIPFECFFNLAL